MHHVFVPNRQVVWVGGAMRPRYSFSVHFTDIMMHAVASPSEDFARPSLYMQLDGAQPSEEDDGDGAAPEVRLVPGDDSQSAKLLVVSAYRAVALAFCSAPQWCASCCTKGLDLFCLATACLRIFCRC